MFYIILFHDLDGSRVVQRLTIVPVLVRILPATTRRVDAVDFTRFCLRELHEDDGTLSDDGIDYESR